MSASSRNPTGQPQTLMLEGWERMLAGFLALVAAIGAIVLEATPPTITKLSANTSCIKQACAVKVSANDSGLIVTLIGIAAAAALSRCSGSASPSSAPAGPRSMPRA